MTAALRLEMPDLAVDIFEDSFGFCFDTDPAKGENREKKYGNEICFLSSAFYFQSTSIF